MNSPLVSILVPVYNATKYGEGYLPTMLESIAGQTLKNFEVLIGDDASTDNTVELVKPFLRDSRFRLFESKTNRGLHHNVVSLLEKARGQFWSPPGQDDILEPRLYEKRAAILAAHPNAVLIHGGATWIDENGLPYQSDAISRGLPELARRLPESRPAKRMLRVLLQHNTVNWPSALVRTDATQKVLAHFSPRWVWAMDWVLWILLAGTGGDFLWDAEPLIRYRMHSQSISGSSRHETARRIERKLAPLCALHDASTFSPMAKDTWLKYRVQLYRWWLTTAVGLKKQGQLSREHLALAKEAFTGKKEKNVSLTTELFCHGIPMAMQYLQERCARRKQYLPVAGFPLVNDPLFQTEKK